MLRFSETKFRFSISHFRNKLQAWVPVLGLLLVSGLWACGETESTQDSPTDSPDLSASTSSPVLLPENCDQYLLVIGEDWNSLTAEVLLINKNSNGQEVAGRSPAVLGKNGMAWGTGLHTAPEGVTFKKEGDKRTPVGMFTLGDCMGYAENAPYKHDWPYLALKTSHRGVDDSESRFYNQVVDTDTLDNPETAFASSEVMRREDDLYSNLFVIEHNKANVPGAGSMLFLHLWRAADKGTAGCTAVPGDFMTTIQQWIRTDRNPVIVQLPEDLYKEVWQDWGLIDPEAI